MGGSKMNGNFQDVIAGPEAVVLQLEMNIKRQISEPCYGTDAVSELPLSEISAQGLDNRRDSKIIRGLPNYSSLQIPNRKLWKDEKPSNEYMRYLSNSSTISISQGRTFTEVPEYLRQFEMSRRGSLTGIRRRVRIDEECPPVTIPTAAPIKNPSRLQRVLAFIGSLHRILGLRHFVLFVVLYVYWIAGMLIFYAIESPNEQKNVAETRDQLNATLESLGRSWNIDPLLLKDAYLTLLKIDGKYTGSAYYKLEERDYPMWQWTYGSAFFYSYTLFSTVGYGTISPSTDWGRIVTIVYTAIGFPVALVIVRDTGAVLLVYITRVYAKIVIKGRSTFAWWKASSDQPIMLNMPIAMLLSVIVMLLTALFVMLYDGWLGPDPGLNYFYAFYFTFLSYAAIGLGDIMPVNLPHSPLIAIVLMSGFPLMRVVNRVLYVDIENGMYGSLTYVEDKIDRIGSNKSENEPNVPTVEATVENGRKQESRLSTLDEDQNEKEHV